MGAGSPSGKPRDEVLLESCGLCLEAERIAFEPFLAPSAAAEAESQQERFARSRFSYPRLADVISQDNAEEVLAIVLKEMEVFEAQAEALGGEAQTLTGTSRRVHHQCEVMEVDLTRLLRLLDEVDFKTLGDARSAGKQ